MNSLCLGYNAIQTIKSNFEQAVSGFVCQEENRTLILQERRVRHFKTQDKTKLGLFRSSTLLNWAWVKFNIALSMLYICPQLANGTIQNMLKILLFGSTQNKLSMKTSSILNSIQKKIE